MWDFAARYIVESWRVVVEMAPWLLFGMFAAGALHVSLPRGFIHRRFGGRGVSDVLKATALGMPMPMCSCGVIPAAIGLKKDGASNGAALAFLITTPQTGLDSILISATFLGWPFAIFLVFSTLITGFVGGVLVNFFERREPPVAAPPACARDARDGFGPRRRIIELFRFGYGELLRDIYVWIVIGVAVAALLSTVVPPDFFTRYAWMQGFGGMLVTLAIAIPLYVCASASIPIAAGLIHAGLPAGSAVVFLIAGPATNVSTLGAVAKSFGRRVIVIYLSTVIGMSLALGWVFQTLVLRGGAHHSMDGHAHGVPDAVSILSACVLLALMAWFAYSDIHASLRSWLGGWRARKAVASMQKTELLVEGMTCQNCAAHVKRALEAVQGVAGATVDLDHGRATVQGETYNPDELTTAVIAAGYKARLASSLP